MAKKAETKNTAKKTAVAVVNGSAVIAQVRELAWTGQHAAAIDSATQALSAQRIKPAEQMSLLDLRAESYVALGNLDLAMQDAKAMGKVAKLPITNYQLRATALNRLALVQMRTGDLKAALKSATASVKASEKSPLLAESLFRLSEAQWRSGEVESAIENAQKSIALYHAAGDKSGEGRAYWSLANAYSYSSGTDDVRRAAQTALELCQSVGDQYGIGNALNALGLADVDIVEAIEHRIRAIEAFEKSGFVERRTIAIGNLSLVYSELGLFPHSRRMQNEVIETSRAIGATLSLAYALGNMLDVEIKLGDLNSVRARVKEFAKLVPSLGDPTSDVSLQISYGDIAFAEGNVKLAVKHYKAAAKISREKELSRETIDLTMLAKALLANKESAAALKTTSKAVEMHRAQSFAKPDGFTSQEVWWRHTQALIANKKTREAREALDKAYEFLLEGIATLSDEGLRRNYLNKVSVNRELLGYWAKDWNKRNGNVPSRYAPVMPHLAIESNVREPFKRLADTGLRLNALHAISEIQTFLVEETTELSGGERVLLILEKQTSEVSKTSEVSVADSLLPRGEDADKVLASIRDLIAQARFTRTVQLVLPSDSSTTLQQPLNPKSQIENRQSRIIAPLIAQNQVLGYLYADMDSLYGTFNEVDRDMLGMLANQAAVALDNAQWAQGLERKVEERTEQLQERVNELQIINAIQQGLASELDFQAIVDLVGDKLREVFNTPDLAINWYDEKANLSQYLYYYEHGVRHSPEPSTPQLDGPFMQMRRTRKPVVWNTVAEGNALFPIIPGTDESISGVRIPIISSDRMIGTITLENYERENAYGESELRLLTTIAASLGTALENARLFDETQRLLKITEDRAAELAIINSVQAALAAKLDLNGIYHAVGEKIREIFNAQSTSIMVIDKQANLEHYPFMIEKGKQLIQESIEHDEMGFGPLAMRTLEPVVINHDMQKRMAEVGSFLIGGEVMPKSAVYVPWYINGEAEGVVYVGNLDSENYFSESDVRLLTTLANAMSVALENARLFDETQRLLKITEERNAELAVINSVQEGLASKLEFQSIIDLIGDKVTEIFNAQATLISLYNPASKEIDHKYLIERGERIHFNKPVPIDKFRQRVVETRQPWLINSDYQKVTLEIGEEPVLEGEEPKSLLFAPMIVGDIVTGIISLQNLDVENAFNDSDVRLLSTIAASMSVALENARLFEETQRLLKITEERAQELAVINSVQEGLASKLFMQAIYDLIGDKIRDIFEAQTVMIVTYDNKTNLMNYPYIFESGERLTSEPLLLDGTGVMDYVITHKQSIMINTDLIERTRQLTGNDGVVVGEGGQMTKSRVDVPMIVGGEVKGGVSLQNVDRENAFTDADLRLLQTLTNAMSVALENARLFDETQRLLKVTEERAAELGAISKVSQALIVESELDSTIQLIGSQMREIFSADIVYLALLDSQTNLIHFPYQFGESFEPLTFGEGLTSKIIQTGEPLLINQNLNERRAQIGATLVGREALSYLGVPIKTGKGTIGVISVQSTTQEGVFTDDSLRLLTTIAANAGAALHNAQLFSEALENLRQVEILTNAASAIELSAYEPAMVESVAARTDALGELARVFAKMADEVRMREQRLKRQLAQMQLDIEEKKLAKAETVAIYIPMDRRQAMAQHVSLPERAHGAALFADVSGFTTLTESLANELGLQRGAEEMIRHLNRVFTVLIDEVHRYSGAVISFSGDAITCWFDDLDLNGNPRADASVERAAACAFAMQKGMTQFAAISTPNGKTIGLSIKVALAVGPTRRMAVGDGSTHQLDVLAGATLTALANAEHESERGEVVLAAANLTSVEETFNVAAWREEKQFAVLAGLKNEVAPSPWAEIGADAIIKSRLRSWMHPTVFEKVRAGQSEMLSELRPATALFMKFGGLDYDNDPQADKKLNAFMQWVEGVIAPHNGSIIQFTVGDKGSYIYIVFGAPIAHRDDAAQAVFTALELASPPESLSYMTDLFIGLASGQMRVGAYGGAGHRTYGAIGDRTNLAARLMMVAASLPPAEIFTGQRAIIVSNESVHEAVQAQVEFISMPPIQVKGKTEPIAVFRPVRKIAGNAANSETALERAQLIDNLPPAEQLTLKVASVIGQLFTFESLSAIYPEKHTNAALQKQLQTLSDLGVIHKRPNEASSYNFKDQQTHEAAYSLMLFAQRRQLHRAVAGLLEQTVFSVPPYAEIAHHWRSANEIPKAIEYLEKAGVHARQMGDFEQATRFFNESLALNK